MGPRDEPETDTMADGEPTDGEATDADVADGEATVEVRVLAMGPLDGSRWLGRGRLPDGSTVDFLTDRAAAERIADVLADGGEALALVRPRQVLG